jgi:hypothetical protein
MEPWYYLCVELYKNSNYNRFAVSKSTFDQNNNLQIIELLQNLYESAYNDVLHNNVSFYDWDTVKISLMNVNGETFGFSELIRSEFDNKVQISSIGDVLYEMYNNTLLGL